ncbi:MAG: hypothetical protein ACPGWR_00960 [Ardenticatenaceae bacterium]
MYVTLDSFLRYQGITFPSDEQRLLIEECLEAAQAFIESPSGAERLFQAEEAEIEVFEPNGRSLKIDDDLDLCEIVSIKVSGVDDESFAVALPPAAFKTKPRRKAPFFAVERRGKVWERFVWIEGFWAYSKEPPAQIAHATKRLAAYFYRQKDTQQGIDGPVVMQSGAMIMPSAVPSDVMKMLYPYRKRL